jgi:hypothetical protein
MVFAEILHKIRQERVGGACQVGRGVRGVTAETAVLVDQRHVVARVLQQVGGRDTCDSGADDQYIDGDVFF